MSALTAGMPIVYGGNRITHVSAELADSFHPGDRLVVVQDSGDLLHIPSDIWEIAHDAVTRAVRAFEGMGGVDDAEISRFYEQFAERLEDEESFAPIEAANHEDVAKSAAAGRSTTRLVLDDKMRTGMIAGLREWAATPSSRGETIERLDHRGWAVETVRSGLGVIGFVFEGRPNVFADATGVLRAGNTVVFRIGSAALGTAQAIMEHALSPALEAAGLPAGSASLVATPARSAGWAMLSDPRLALAVARGSGEAVSQLGAVARQAGTPVSLHGTGGAWIVAAESADPDWFRAAVHNSLDRKVCNTLNTCCIVASRAEDLIPRFLEALDAAGEARGATSKLHVTRRAAGYIPEDWFETATIVRSQGNSTEPRTEVIGEDALGEEWEWEESPEVTLTIVDDVAEAVSLFNDQSPRFAASLISEIPTEHETFFETVDSPFVGNGYTRWVDGQYAFNRPELGLSNWQFGRLFGRGGVLSGDSAYTVRTRARQTDPDLHR